jgi:hypothetical protein
MVVAGGADGLSSSTTLSQKWPTRKDDFRQGLPGLGPLIVWGNERPLNQARTCSE